jgi:hypothetical protein
LTVRCFPNDRRPDGWCPAACLRPGQGHPAQHPRTTYVSGVARPYMVLGIVAVVVYDEVTWMTLFNANKPFDIHYALEDEQHSSTA